MKSKLSKRFLAILLSCLLVMASFAGTFTVGATTDEDAIRAAFEEYVASTVLTGTGYSSTYSDAKLIAYLEGKGYTGISIVGAGTTTPQSYLQHAQAGFITGAAGYENLFATKDGYVSVVLSYNGANIGCIATIPADTFGSTDIDTVSTDADFTVVDGVVTAYNGSAEIVVLKGKVSSAINWGDNAENIKVVVLTVAQSFGTDFTSGAAFGGTKLPNLQALVYANGSSFAEGDTYHFSGATKLTHIRLPNNGIHLSHHFADGLSSLIVLENADKVSRLGWAGLSGTSLSTVTIGSGHAEWHVRASGLASSLPAKHGVTPVWYTLYSCTGDYKVLTSDGTSERWNTTVPPIVYFRDATALANYQASSLYANGKLIADYRLKVNDLVRVSASVKAATDKLTGVAPSATGALTAITAGVTLPDGFTLDWVDDTFAVVGDKATGTLALSDGTNTVKFDVAIPTMDPIGTVQGVFEEYVASTVITTNGMSSTYSDAGLLNALVQKGHAVTLVDSYLQHSQSGFTTAVPGYENLFAAQDGAVSVLLKDTNGSTHALVAPIPAYTYDHTADITTVSKESDFTVVDGTITAYNGSANLLVIDKPISSSITWGANAANIKAIVYKGTQQFGGAFNTNATFASSKLSNLLAFRMEGGSFHSSENLNFFNGNNKITHFALPKGGVYMVPNHFMNGRSGIVRVDNMAGVERFGWAAFNSTNLSTFEAGVGRGSFYTDYLSFGTSAANSGVTPVIILHHTNPSIQGADSGNWRWASTVTPIIYANTTTYTNIQNGSIGGMKKPAEWHTATPTILKAAAALQGKVSGLTEVVGAAAPALSEITAGVDLTNLTVEWVADTFKVEDGNVTGTLKLTDGTNTVTFAVSAKAKVASNSLIDDFKAYVASTVITDSGLSSTYSDAKMLEYLWAKGHGVSLVDSYLQHAESGFVTSALGYENLFAAQDGYVSVLFKDANGNNVACTATIPAYTYKHYDIDTVTSYATNPEDFVLTDDVITAYNGTAEVLILDKAVSPTFTVANGSSVKVIIITSGQTFADGNSGFHASANRFSVKFPELLAVRFENGSVAYGGDNGMFASATKLTHMAVNSGLYMIPHHFLSGATALVRLDNDHVVERIGYNALANTKLATIEAGLHKGAFWTDSGSMNTAVGALGVTPVIKLHNANPAIQGAGTGNNRWNPAYPPVIYCNEATYNNIQNGSVAGLKAAATWKTATPAILKDAAKAQAAINNMIATVDGADALAAAQAAVGEGYTLAWESYELNGMNGTGVMTMTDGETTVTLAYDELAMQMVNGASIRYMTPAGIRFATRINGIAKLEDEGYTVKVGTIIAINSAKGTTEFTKDALTAAGVKYLDIATAKWAEAGLTEFGAYENLTFNVVHGIPATSYATDLSARTYVEATKDGVTETWYSDYSELNNTRSIREVAIKVYDGAPESVKGTLDEYINGAQ